MRWSVFCTVSTAPIRSGAMSEPVRLEPAAARQCLARLGLGLWQCRLAPPGAAPVLAARSDTPPPMTTAALPEPAMRVSTVTPDWDVLAAQVRACQACRLHQTRTQTVFGVGNRQARWMVIGEAPGADEDAQGEPFVGRAGQLLNAMLRGIGLQREQVYIANVLKCRPPQNRDPLEDETVQCLPYLRQQILGVQPRLLLAVGRVAAQALLATATPIGQLRGSVHEYAGVPLVVTYHPAYLLRSPTQKRKAWEDLLLARRVAAPLAP